MYRESNERKVVDESFEKSYNNTESGQGSPVSINQSSISMQPKQQQLVPESTKKPFNIFLIMTSLIIIAIGASLNYQSFIIYELDQNFNQQSIKFYIKENITNILDLDCRIDNEDLKKFDNQFIAEGCKSKQNPIFATDYFQQLELVQKYDWIQVLEMEKIIPEDKIDVFLNNIMQLSKQGIVISWDSFTKDENVKDTSKISYFISILSNFFLFDKRSKFPVYPQSGVQNILVFRKVLSIQENSFQSSNKATQLPIDQPNFTVRAANTRYFSSLLQYLAFNRIKTMLQVNCKGECLQNIQNNSHLNEISVTFWPDNQNWKAIKSDISASHDWINCENFEFCVDLFLNNKFLMKKIKYGVSFRNVQIIQFEKSENFDRIVSHFESYGFYYDEIKSLNLIKPESKMIMIFIKGKPQEKTLPFKKPTKNAIATHIILRMVENVEYMREWIGYHLNLGIDKFFVYDNSNSIKSEMVKYDYLVTAETTKIGLNLACYNLTKDQIKKKWEEVWLEFYDHIVYVVWEPKDEKGEIIYGQMKALEDYVFYFKHVAKYTAYIDPDEFIFSPDNLDLEQYLRKKESQGVSTLRIKSRHFPHRVCGPNKRVTDMVHYYPHTLEGNVRLWAPKIICVTKSFKPWGSIHDGETTSGIRQTPPDNQLRFNHYAFEYFSLVVGMEAKYSNSTKLLFDDSLRKRYSKVIDDICHSKCSENFAISCPPGKQFLYCIDANDELPATIAEAQNFKYKLEHKNSPAGV